MNFKIRNREQIYHGRAFDVEKVQAALPNGVVRSYDLVRHVGAVTIVPLNGDGTVYFVRQYRLGSSSELLELPAGTLEENEDPRDCALREVREETGLAAGQIEKLGDFFLAPGYSTEHMHVFLAQQLYSSPLEADVDEFLQVVPIPAVEVLAMVRTNQIKDAKTLAALLLAHDRLLQFK